MPRLRVHESNVLAPFHLAPRPFAAVWQLLYHLQRQAAERIPCAYKDQREDDEQAEAEAECEIFPRGWQVRAEPTALSDQHYERVEENRALVENVLHYHQADAVADVKPLIIQIPALHRYRRRAAAGDEAEHAQKRELKGLAVAQLRQATAYERHAHGGVEELVAKTERKQRDERRCAYRRDAVHDGFHVAAQHKRHDPDQYEQRQQCRKY